MAWSANARYATDIAGIMRDNDYPLYQRISQSTATTGDIIVEAIGEMNNKSSLIWANNAESITGWSTTTIDVTQVDGRVDRVWHFQERGQLGNVKIRIPVFGLPSV